MATPAPPAAPREPTEPIALIDERLTLAAFPALAGRVSGIPYVKLLLDKETGSLHFIADAAYRFHSDYVAERILGIPAAALDARIDEWNRENYRDPRRRFLIGTVALLTRDRKPLFALETADIDDMGPALIEELYAATRRLVDPTVPLVFKPANHGQEVAITAVDPARVPRVLARELFGDATYVPLCPGRAEGRLRIFRSEADFRRAAASVDWRDILAMPRVPDDAPRVAGFLHGEPVTPLSHVNVLAHGWAIPNAVQRGCLDDLEARGLDGRWVRYEVDPDADAARVTPLEVAPGAPPQDRPRWALARVRVEPPERRDLAVRDLASLRAADADRFGTKAANLGELFHVLSHGSPRLLGFYRIPRPPREDLLDHVAARLGLPATADEPTLLAAAHAWLARRVRVPRGVAIPFGVAEAFFARDAGVARAQGRLSLAVELGARELDAVCLALQQEIRRARVPVELGDAVDEALADRLGGARSLVVRSSSNAEDLPGFSAAGIYDSRTHVTTRDAVVDALRDVWASLYSPRAVRLRVEAGIGFDDACMGAIVEEEIPMAEGACAGVLVTQNPLVRGDFRHAYVNVSRRSVVDVVTGRSQPMQFLFNTVEGGGRTLSLGEEARELDEASYRALDELSFAGRLLQSCFSPDYAFATPLDVEWILSGGTLWLLQVRPYGA